MRGVDILDSKIETVSFAWRNIFLNSISAFFQSIDKVSTKAYLYLTLCLIRVWRQEPRSSATRTTFCSCWYNFRNQSTYIFFQGHQLQASKRSKNSDIESIPCTHRVGHNDFSLVLLLSGGVSQSIPLGHLTIQKICKMHKCFLQLPYSYLLLEKSSHQ